MKRQDDPGNFDFTLAMGGVDKLHEVNIKGNGIKVGFVDTGIDYNHPALGAGYGPGKKIAGGYTFIADDGTLVEGPDPFANCSERIMLLMWQVSIPQTTGPIIQTDQNQGLLVWSLLNFPRVSQSLV